MRMTDPNCFYRISSEGIATLILNRADTHNVLNEAMIKLLLDSLLELESSDSVRAVLITSSGKNFCAGADLHAMQVARQQKKDQVHYFSEQLAQLMQTLHMLQKPTVALVHGAAYGGGAGLVACCDIALASLTAHFCFSEVRLGLIPAVISPYILKAIGERQTRRYFLTAEKITADEACRIGLVHEVVAESALNDKVETLMQDLVAGGPNALTSCKILINAASSSPIDPNFIAKTAKWITEVRQTDEAKAGIHAFLEKRPANWLKNL